MKSALCLAVLAAVAVPAVAGGPQNPRLATIWDAAHDRLDLQGDYWFDGGDFPRAINSLRLAQSIYPEDYEVATNLGWLLESTEQWDEALAVYVRYGRENPSDKDAPYPEANFYFMKKVYSKVPPLLEPTISKNPHPNSFRLLAHSYEKLGMFRDAVRVWNAYIEVAPDDRAAKKNLESVENKMKGVTPPPPPTR